MEQNTYQNTKKIDFLCRDCINCKTKNGETYCKEGYFTCTLKNDIIKTLIYSPIDFDCYEWEGV